MNTILMTLNKWDSRWGSRQILTAGLAARGHHAVYSSGPQSVWERSGRFWQSAGLKSRLVEDRGVLVDVPGKLFPRWPSHQTYDCWAIRRHAVALRNAVFKQSGDQTLNLVVCHPSYVESAKALNPDALIYFPYDDFALVPGWNERAAAQEAELVDAADLIVGFSEEMTKRLTPRPGVEKRVLSLAVDFSVYDKARGQPEPEDLRHIPHPRIGYAGSINEKNDWQLVLSLVRSRPDYHWVVLGQEMLDKNGQFFTNPAASDAWMLCKKESNFHYLGERGFGEVATYVLHTDVNAMPYAGGRDGWWTNGFPLKLYEYLATGSPVVGTRLSALSGFEDVVAMPDGEAAWLDELDAAIANKSEEQRAARVALARENDWGNRINSLDTWLREIRQ